MVPVGAILAVAAGAAAHQRRVAEQKRMVTAAGPVWDQVAARLGFQASRDAGGYPTVSGVLDDVPCSLQLTALSNTFARVDARARARVPTPWRLTVRDAGPRILRWTRRG